MYLRKLFLVKKQQKQQQQKKTVSSPFSILKFVPPGPSIPLTYIVSIDYLSLQDKGLALSRGNILLIKNGDDPIFVTCDPK